MVNSHMSKDRIYDNKEGNSYMCVCNTSAVDAVCVGHQ